MALLKEEQDFKLKKVTLEEFDNLPPDERHYYEFVDDIVLMTPRPGILHQRILGEFFAQLHTYFKDKPCRILSEVEIKLKKDIFIPDLSILCDPDKFTDQRYEGAPTITIEILSPRTRGHDLITKLNKYYSGGVKEYWIVEPKSQTVTIHHFETGDTDLYTCDETLTTPLFEGLSIDLKTIFD
ncbi:MAG: Uma2 family endonuclease [Eubacterium sp.]